MNGGTNGIRNSNQLIIGRTKMKNTKCQCGCGKDIDSHLLFILEELQDDCPVKFIITSGARCKAHNKAVGGVESSAHVSGLAVDIAINNSWERYHILRSLCQEWTDVVRIGVARDFIHMDIDKNKPQEVVWLY
jgi:uncharacterized protein YcbK (DUF882 family)